MAWIWQKQSMLRRGWENIEKNYTKKYINDPDNHDGVITHLGIDIMKCEVKGVFRSITIRKTSGGDGIARELFEILRNDAVKVLHSLCQQIWNTQQWPQDWKGHFDCNPKERQVQRMFNCHTFALISHATKVISPSKSSTVHQLWNSICSIWI